MANITTIKISTETKERLEKLREYDRETFNDVLNKMFYVLNICKKDPMKAQRILNNIDRRIKRKDVIKKKMKVVEK
ncbi:Uncharacterised protein [uncultured archaeon]|nr:Uncharacterised protein [uncultured archaeon]